MDVNSLVQKNFITNQDAKCTTTKNMNNLNVYSSLPTSAIIELGLQEKERTNERGEEDDEQLVWVHAVQSQF